MSETKFCQSCGMPLDSKEVCGTNQDGRSSDLRVKDGAFVDDCTMDEMIEGSVRHMKESGMLKEQNKTEEEAREFMYSFFPELKRWK